MIWQSHMAQSGEMVPGHKMLLGLNPCSFRGHCSHKPVWRACKSTGFTQVRMNLPFFASISCIPTFEEIFFQFRLVSEKSWSRVGPILPEVMLSLYRLICWNSLYRQWKMFPSWDWKEPRAQKTKGTTETLHRNDGITWYKHLWNKLPLEISPWPFREHWEVEMLIYCVAGNTDNFPAFSLKKKGAFEASQVRCTVCTPQKIAIWWKDPCQWQAQSQERLTPTRVLQPAAALTAACSMHGPLPIVTWEGRLVTGLAMVEDAEVTPNPLAKNWLGIQRVCVRQNLSVWRKHVAIHIELFQSITIHNMSYDHTIII